MYMKGSPIKIKAGVVSPLKNNNTEEEDEKDEKVAKKYQPVVDWFKKYLGSDTYNVLTGKMKEKGGYTDYFVDEATQSQKRYVENYPNLKEGEYDTGKPSITEKKHAGTRGYATVEHASSEKGQVINIDPDLSDKDAFDVMMHELGHTDKGDMTKSAIKGQLMSEKNPYFLELINAMAEADPEIKNLLKEENYYQLLKKVDGVYRKNPDDLMKEYGISRELAYTASWAAQPYEVRSELMTLRYQAEEAGIHISTGKYEEFTQEKLDALRKVLDEEGNPLNNLLLNTKFKDGVEFSDEDIIWYMNNIAMENEEKKQDFTGEEMDKDSALTMLGKIKGGI